MDTAQEVSLVHTHCRHLGARAWYRASHCQRTVIVPCGLWLAKAAYTGPGVMSKVSLDVGVPALLASIVPLYKIEWVPCQLQGSLGIPITVALAPCLGGPGLPVPGTPEIYICPPLTHTHITHIHSRPLTSLLCHTLSLPEVLSGAIEDTHFM